MGGLLATGNLDRTNSTGSDEEDPRNVRSRHYVFPQSDVVAQISPSVGRMDHQGLLDKQSKTNLTRNVPPTAPQYHGDSRTIEYADLDFTSYPRGHNPNLILPPREITAYSQVSHVISGEDGRKIAIVTDDISHDSSSDEEFDFDVPPSITEFRRQSEVHRSHSPLPPGDFDSIPHPVVARSTSPVSPNSSNSVYDNLPILSSQGFQRNIPPPLVPAQGIRTAPPVPAHQHSSSANRNVGNQLYSHPAMNEEPAYDLVAADQSSVLPITSRPSNQIGTSIRSNQALPSYRGYGSTMISHGPGSGTSDSHYPHSAASTGDSSIQHLTNQGYTRDQVIRALAISHNDFKMAEQILKEFGK